MKHIKICKPHNQSEKSLKQPNENSINIEKINGLRRGKSLPSVSEGLGCVPSGNLFNQD